MTIRQKIAAVVSVLLLSIVGLVGLVTPAEAVSTHWSPWKVRGSTVWNVRVHFVWNAGAAKWTVDQHQVKANTLAINQTYQSFTTELRKVGGATFGEEISNSGPVAPPSDLIWIDSPEPLVAPTAAYDVRLFKGPNANTWMCTTNNYSNA